MKRVRGGPDEVEALIVNTAQQDGRGVQIGLPQDPGQAGKQQVLYLTRKLEGICAEMADLLPWIEGHPGAAAWVQAVGAIIALIVAIGVPWRQGRQAHRAEQRTRADELSSLRLALYNEVAMLANLSLGQFDKSPTLAARLPRLIIFEANAGKVGLLTEDEIIALVALSSVVHDLSVVVNDKAMETLQNSLATYASMGTVHDAQEIRQKVRDLLSLACGEAANFMAAVPGIGTADKDQPFIKDLRKCYASGRRIVT